MTFVIGLALKTKPLKTQSSMFSNNTEAKPTSSLVSDVLVKNTSPLFTLYLSMVDASNSTLPVRSEDTIEFFL